MTPSGTTNALRRVTGSLFLVGAVAFAIAATVLSSTFNWPDILREPASVVLPEFVAGGNSLVWTWFATAWTYAILAVPILLLPAALGRRDDPALRVATYIGATSVVLALVGFLRWVFVVPPLAHSYVTGDATTQAATGAAWTAQHQFGGALLGEHLGQLMAIGWSVTVSIMLVRTRALPRWLGIAGLAVSALYLLNQGDVLATAVAGFPVWDLAGLLGSTTWGLWVAVLGVMLLLRRAHPAAPGQNQASTAIDGTRTSSQPDTADSRKLTTTRPIPCRQQAMPLREAHFAALAGRGRRAGVVEASCDDYRQRMVTVADVRALALTLPRTSEHLIHDRVKFRVGSIVYAAFSRDETTMGFGYPKEERDTLVAGEPDLFFLPGASDLRFHWVCCHLARLDHGYMTELITDAWRMVVPKFLARQRLGS